MLPPLLAFLTHEPAICTHVHAASIKLGATSYTVKAFVTRCGMHVVLCYKFLLITELEWAKYTKKRKKKAKKVEMPLALRGHVTNASFTQWVWILLMPKIVQSTNSYNRNLRGNAGRYFMALWFFIKVVWFVLAAMLEGTLFPSNMAAKTTFWLYLGKRLIVTLRCALKGYHIIFSTFSLKFKCKFVLRKR